LSCGVVLAFPRSPVPAFPAVRAPAYNAGMVYTYEAAKRAALEAVRRIAGADVGLSLATPPAGVPADLAIPCFPLAAALHASPQDPIGELLRLYVKFDAEARRDPSLRDQARQWHLRLEQGDPDARALWHEFVRHSLAAFQKIYDLLEVRFDHTLGESFYEDKMGEVIETAVR